MIEAGLSVLAVLLSIVLFWIKNSQKTEQEKRLGTVKKSRARGSRMMWLLRERKLDELQKELERQDREHTAVMAGMRDKASDSSGE